MWGVRVGKAFYPRYSALPPPPVRAKLSARKMDDGDAACAPLDQARGDDEDCLTEDEEDDAGGIDPFLNGYEGWLAQWKAGQHVRANEGGSRPLPENTVDEVAFAIAVWDGAREE